MLILISPSKTQNKKCFETANTDTSLFKKQTSYLLDSLVSNIDNQNLSDWLEIKNNPKLLKTTIDDIKNYKTNKAYKAIEFYSGLQFKNIYYRNLNDNQQELINNHLLIMSAFYGLVLPNQYIKPYRLMMGSQIKLNNYKDLYQLWSNEINNYLLKQNKLIINLTSQEYGKILDQDLLNIVNIDFKVFKNNKYISVATMSKQCRGNFIYQFSLVNFDLTKLKELDVLGFKYNKELSDNKNYIFTK